MSDLYNRINAYLAAGLEGDALLREAQGLLICPKCYAINKSDRALIGVRRCDHAWHGLTSEQEKELAEVIRRLEAVEDVGVRLDAARAILPVASPQDIADVARGTGEVLAVTLKYLRMLSGHAPHGAMLRADRHEATPQK